MPFARPSLRELVDQARGDLRAKLEIAGPLLRRAMADVFGAVWGGSVHLLYGYLDWIGRQVFARTAERAQLIAKCAPYGIAPIEATYATGTATATGTNGTTIPTGTVLSLDSATSYRVTTGQTIAGGVAALPVEAVLAGSIANIPTGTALSLERPIAGVSSTVTVASPGIAGGQDEETTDHLRERYYLRLRKPPEGGADRDYIEWALSVAGVTRAWVYRRELGLGTVVVRFVRDGESPIFPDAGEVAAVQAALEAKRPNTADVTAVAPTSLAVPLTLHIAPDTADTRAAVLAQVGDLLTTVAAPGDGAGRGTVLLSQLRTAIGVATGVVDYTLSTPTADVVPGVGQLPILGTVTWT